MGLDCINSLHWYWSSSYGNCWQFNSGFNLTNQKIDIKNTVSNGLDWGLKVQLLLVNENNLTKTNDKGAVVFIHNSSFRPSQEIFIKPKEKTFIQVERTFIQKQPQPYSDCIDLTSYSSELYDYIIKQGQAYRQQDCFDLCYQRLALQNCECYVPGIQNLSTTLRPCLNSTDIECCKAALISFNLDDCQTKYCPLECDTIKYDLTLSSLDSTNQNYFVNVSNLSELSFVSFHVYYPSLQYTLLTESPKMTIADLFSQIGGSLGLFVSFSIFTLFEFIELLIFFVYGLLIKKKLNNVDQAN